MLLIKLATGDCSNINAACYRKARIFLLSRQPNRAPCVFYIDDIDDFKKGWESVIQEDKLNERAQEGDQESLLLAGSLLLNLQREMKTSHVSGKKSEIWFISTK
jgi:hypothetical protein